MGGQSHVTKTGLQCLIFLLLPSEGCNYKEAGYHMSSLGVAGDKTYCFVDAKPALQWFFSNKGSQKSWGSCVSTCTEATYGWKGFLLLLLLIMIFLFVFAQHSCLRTYAVSGSSSSTSVKTTTCWLQTGLLEVKGLYVVHNDWIVRLLPTSSPLKLVPVIVWLRSPSAGILGVSLHSWGFWWSLYEIMKLAFAYL